MGRILNCFKENSVEFIELLSTNLNHIVFMLRKREAITEDQELSVQQSPSKYKKIENLFTYIEVNEGEKTFIKVLNHTNNGGIAGYVRLADLYYFTTKLKKSELFKIGADVDLSCEVRTYHDVQWLKSGIEISSDTKYRLKTDGLVHHLIIMNAQGEDAGDYVCKCCFDRTECTIKADIKVIEGLKSLEVVNGESLQLTCKFNANVNVKWSRNGQELSKDNRIDFIETAEENLFKHTLTIKNAKEENSGEYSCFYQKMKTFCHVIVKEKPIEEIISAGTTEILHEISDSKHKLEKKKEQINTKEVNLTEIETEIKTTEQEIEIESKKSKLPLESTDSKSRETEKYQFNDYCRNLREENAKLRENAIMMSAELKELKEERQKLEKRVAVLERHIDSANEKHQKTIEETIAKLNEKHETTLEDIKKIMHERESKTCAVS